MQGAVWRQSHVLAVREKMEELPEPEREKAADVLGCARLLDPTLAVELVGKLAAKKPAERSEIYELSQSEDPRKQTLALTKCAELPPMPDPRLAMLDTAVGSLQKAAKPYPKDPLTPRIVSVIDDIRVIRAEVKAVSFDARNNHAQKGARVQ